MYCKDCFFRRQDRLGQRLFYCTSPKLVESSSSSDEHVYDPQGDRLVYSYEENGLFYVEDHFGCVHFEPK